MSDLLPYKLSENESVEVTFVNNDIWITQRGLAQLLDVNTPAISKHIKNIFTEGELEEKAVVSKMETTALDGKSYLTLHYNLDVIIAVGYRVNSKKATQFRKWATQVLQTYIQDGYVVNETLLRDDPAKLNQLAAKIRELRANEKNVFAQVRECFKISSSDYEPTSKEVRSFYALLQDKFHHAITRMTSSKLIMDRANYKDENMGLVTFKDLFPTKKEVQTGKNYLTDDELYRMFLLSEQFLLFAESSALMGKKLTMKDLHEQLDKLLELNGYPVFDGYNDFLKDRALEHAERELELFIEIKKLEMLGVDVDLVDYDNGAYKHYQQQIDGISLMQLKKQYDKNIKTLK